MDAISLMVEEHKNIKRVLKVIRKLCINILNGKEVDYDVFYRIIDFVRNYADRHHHSKEEDILFKKMTEELRDIMESPIYGMLAEHDLGRLYIRNLEEAVERVKKGDMDSRVDIIANAIAYTDLLHRHIDKEDNTIYKFGKEKLSKKALKEVQYQSEKVEREAEEKNIQNKYIKLIEELEEIAGI
jgi:hemerythrin-like domain-containing protein